jgi:hypothetical protein
MLHIFEGDGEKGEGNTVELGYNDVGLCYISHLASYVFWYQLIPHC